MATTKNKVSLQVLISPQWKDALEGVSKLGFSKGKLIEMAIAWLEQDAREHPAKYGEVLSASDAAMFASMAKGG